MKYMLSQNLSQIEESNILNALLCATHWRNGQCDKTNVANIQFYIHIVLNRYSLFSDQSMLNFEFEKFYIHLYIIH